MSSGVAQHTVRSRTEPLRWASANQVEEFVRGEQDIDLDVRNMPRAKSVSRSLMTSSGMAPSDSAATIRSTSRVFRPSTYWSTAMPPKRS